MDKQIAEYLKEYEAEVEREQGLTLIKDERTYYQDNSDNTYYMPSKPLNGWDHIGNSIWTVIRLFGLLFWILIGVHYCFR